MRVPITYKKILQRQTRKPPCFASAKTCLQLLTAKGIFAGCYSNAKYANFNMLEKVRVP